VTLEKNFAKYSFEHRADFYLWLYFNLISALYFVLPPNLLTDFLFNQCQTLVPNVGFD